MGLSLEQATARLEECSGETLSLLERMAEARHEVNRECFKSLPSWEQIKQEADSAGWVVTQMAREMIGLAMLEECGWGILSPDRRDLLEDFMNEFTA